MATIQILTIKNLNNLPLSSSSTVAIPDFYSVVQEHYS